MPVTTARMCPACGNTKVTLIPRGYAGQTDEPDQYIVCQECGRVTYEILAVSQRDIRLYRYEVNNMIARDGIVYRIRRILKVGFDEFLLYLHPEVVEPDPVDEESSEPEPVEETTEP